MTHAPRHHHTGGDENRLLTIAVILSLAGHILLFTLSHVMTTSGYKPHKTPRSIDVDLVQPEHSREKQAKASARRKPGPSTPKTAQATSPSKQATRKKSAKKIHPPTTKTITGNKSVKLNRKVITPDELVKNALQKIAREASKPEPLSNRMNRLKKEVADRKETGKTAAPVETAKGQPTAAQISIKERYYRTIEVIIRKNWAYPVQMAGTGTQLKTQIIFTVMPDGSVRDVWVSQRSGNASFDRSALSAVHKSTPLPPYPAGINDQKIPFVIDFDISELL